MAPCILTAPPGAGGAPPPTGGSLVANIRWDTATGSSLAALRDDNNPVAFDHVIECGGAIVDVMSVVTAASAGLSPWPTTNALRITTRGSTACGNVEWSSNAASSPANPNGTGGNRAPFAASQSHYGRVYFSAEANFSDNHGIAYNAGGVIQAVPLSFHSITTSAMPGGGTLGNNVVVSIKPPRSGEQTILSYPWNSWSPGIEGGLGDRFFPTGTTYRYEWHLEYVSALAYRIYPRVYDASGTLLYDVTTYYPVNASPATYSLADHYAAGHTFGMTDAEIAREFSVGHEGPGGAANTGASIYLGDLAFSLTGWVGA